MLNTKKTLSIIISFIMIVVFISGCTVKQETNEDEIKIGINYELSGEVATYGQSSVDGIELALEEINAAGGVLGKKIVWDKVDNKSEPAEATNVATRLITQNKVVAILGPATSGNVKAASPVSMQNKVPLLSGSSTDDDVTVDANGVKEYIFRLCYTDSFQGTAMANYATKSMEAKKAAILIDNASDYSKGLAKNFKETFIKNEGQIVAEEAYVAGEKDFKAILTKIKTKDFDIIYLPGYYEDVGLIIKQARELDIDQPVLGADGYDSPKLTEIAGEEALNNVFFSNHYSSQDTAPIVVDFRKAFKEKYNKEADGFNALGYDIAKLLVDAIERADSEESEKIKDALKATEDFEAVTGTLTIDENHNPIKAITVIELVDGEHTFNEKIEP